jgi:hypothetical protein
VDCQYFERGHWFPEYGGGEQLGGNCRLLCDVLKITNSYLIWQDSLHVQESFGCSLFAPNKEVSGGRSTSAALTGSQGG